MRTLVRKTPARAPGVAPTQGFTARSAVLGVALVVGIAVAAPWARFVLPTSLLDSEFLPLGVVFPIALVAIVGRAIAPWLRARWRLTRADLGLVFIMALCAASVASGGLTEFLVSNIAAPRYLATPENRWDELFGPHLRGWLFPPNDRGQMTWFFLGKPESAAIPWGAWVAPLFWWLSLFAATAFAGFCLVVLLRRQWVEHERLAYPLMAVPLALADGLRNPPFWLKRGFLWGAGISGLWGLVSVLPMIVPGMPRSPNTFGQIRIGHDFPPMHLFVLFPIIGFAWFVPVDVLGGIWFFHVVATVEAGVFNRLGISSGTPDIHTAPSHAIGWQSFGALTVLVLGMLWTARREIGRAIAEAFRPAPERHADENGLVSHRTAVFGLAAGVLYIAVWLWRSGMSVLFALFFIFALFVIQLGITRIVAQSGLVFVRATMSAQSFAMSLLGTASLTGAAFTSIAGTYAWSHTVWLVMPALAHAAKLAGDLRLKARHVVAAIFAGIALAAVVSIGVTLAWGYEIGAENFTGWVFPYGKNAHWGAVVAKMNAPRGVDWPAIGQYVIGGTVMSALLLVVRRFPGWPFHPIGLTIGYTHPTAMMAFSIFLVWAAKATIVKTGGRPLSERAKPVFLGLALGYLAVIGVAALWDLLVAAPGEGHVIYGL